MQRTTGSNIEPPDAISDKSWKGNMSEHNADQSQDRGLNQGRLWKVCLGLLGGVLLTLALGSAALNHLLAQVPDRAQRVTARTGWYFRSGQWQADVRTLAAACQFIMANDAAPAATNYANLPAAESAGPVPPESGTSL